MSKSGYSMGQSTRSCVSDPVCYHYKLLVLLQLLRLLLLPYYTTTTTITTIVGCVSPTFSSLSVWLCVWASHSFFTHLWFEILLKLVHIRLQIKAHNVRTSWFCAPAAKEARVRGEIRIRVIVGHRRFHRMLRRQQPGQRMFYITSCLFAVQNQDVFKCQIYHILYYREFTAVDMSEQQSAYVCDSRSASAFVYARRSLISDNK